MKPIDESPEAGDECPYCSDGILEVTEFGEGDERERFAVCEGVEGDPDAGCGWEEHYGPNDQDMP